MDNGYTLSVTQLNEYVNGMLRRDPLLSSLSIRGEISGFKRHSSGHLYFSLKDTGARISCVMFRQNAVSLAFRPEDGQSVVASGSVSVYVRDGQYQLYVDSMQPEGEGELYRRFLLLKTRLQAQGIFEEQHKKPLPLLPACLGVITSPTGAAIQDILQIAHRRFPNMRITLCPVRVQGEGAAQEIAAAIARMDALHAADVLIVGRGGGSFEDLWAFNEECVARAIYACATPIVSAVGHETDFSLADFAADLRAPTPSAAAELCVPEYARLRADIQDAALNLRARCHARLSDCRGEVQTYAGRAAQYSPGHRVRLLRGQVEATRAQAVAALHMQVMGAYNSLQQADAALRALNPRQVLNRGYAMVQTQAGYIGGAGALRAGQAARLILRDGRADITVDKVQVEGE
ncbi:MAG: exodeoxyribonuclease VII large subunit [Christensenellaceae bacterium]|jgi:exodeoxyribonuclease VII large subunit|nr:exodeoxyribonuclease VII large subunit [Christensenellaceae bacterium]